MASKRFITHQGDTPGKPGEKVSRRAASRKSLFPQEESAKGKRGPSYACSEKEISCIVEFIALFWERNEKDGNWPTLKCEAGFWDKCARFVSENAKTDIRSGDAVRTRVRKQISVEFSTIEDSEEFFKIDYLEGSSSIGKEQEDPFSTPAVSLSAQNNYFSMPTLSPSAIPNSPVHLHATSSTAAETLVNLTGGYAKLTPRMQEQLLSVLFQN